MPKRRVTLHHTTVHEQQFACVCHYHRRVILGVRHEARLSAAHREHARLGWGDDGAEVRDAQHAQIGNGERADLTHSHRK